MTDDYRLRLDREKNEDEDIPKDDMDTPCL